MSARSGRLFALVSLAALLVCVRVSGEAAPAALPDRLTDGEFWALTGQLSEPGGHFRSDNLVSNERHYPEVLRDLTRRVPPGSVYLGVGPEQNFSYIAATRPAMAFVVDVRRGNLHLHLMYKALFELSADRVDFVSRLFTKPRPSDLRADASVGDIMGAFGQLDTSGREVFDRNVRDVQTHLTRTRALPLSDDDLAGVADIYFAFYWYGPSITYGSSSTAAFRRRSTVTFHELMLAADDTGQLGSFLATDDAFRFVKRLHARNLVVPVVGDFGGATALRAVGQYLRQHDATVGTFYLSNVEQYLRQQGTLGAFCANIASLPLDSRSTFIRSQSTGGGFRNSLGSMMAETSACLGAADRQVPVGMQ